MKSMVEVVQYLLKPYIDSQIQTLSTALTNAESNIAPVEDGTKYSKTYVLGEEFIRNHLLYKVIVSSVGTTDNITIGTNCERAEAALSKDEFSSTDFIIPIKVERSGRVCVLRSRYAKLSSALTANTSSVIGTLPVGMRPKETIFLGVTMVSAVGNLVAYAFVTINSSGVVEVIPNTSVASGSYVFFSVTYETA